MKLNALACSLFLCIAGPVHGLDFVTAQHLGANGGFNGALGGSGFTDYAGQTFTAQISGILNTISYQVADGGQSIPISFSILDTSSGVPNAVLASVQIPATAVPDNYTLFQIDFSAFGVPIVAGNQYALTAKPATNTTAFSPGWQFTTGDLYSGGRGLWHPSTGWDPNSTFIEPDYDFGFQVTVVPEASTISVFLLGTAFLLGKRIKKGEGFSKLS